MIDRNVELQVEPCHPCCDPRFPSCNLDSGLDDRIVNLLLEPCGVRRASAGWRKPHEPPPGRYITLVLAAPLNMKVRAVARWSCHANPCAGLEDGFFPLVQSAHKCRRRHAVVFTQHRDLGRLIGGASNFSLRKAGSIFEYAAP